MLMAVDQRCHEACESTNADLKSFIGNVLMWRRLTSGERVIDIERPKSIEISILYAVFVVNSQ